MTIETRDFGEMELNENELLLFMSPIFGYEELQQYALLSDDETGGSGLMWLQSVDEPETCFILLNPEEIGLPYSPELPEDMRKMLAISDAPVYRLIAVVPHDFRQTTVNLKSPIVINPQRKLAAQVILEADYPIRMRLFDSEEDEEC